MRKAKHRYFLNHDNAERIANYFKLNSICLSLFVSLSYHLFILKHTTLIFKKSLSQEIMHC